MLKNIRDLPPGPTKNPGGMPPGLLSLLFVTIPQLD
jgi:hypothetical protein